MTILPQPDWTPTLIENLTSNLAAEAEPLWHGLIARGTATLLSAEAKAGKTTLLALLCKEFAEGGHLCGSPVQPARVFVISEEPAHIWKERHNRMGYHPGFLHLLCQPFVTKPSRNDWEKLIAHIAAQIQPLSLDLVVLDTLSHLWSVDDENDNARVATALMPLRQLTQAAIGVLCVHHFGRAGTTRGASALEAFHDHLIEFSRIQGLREDSKDRRRKLTARGRLYPDPVELIVELTKCGTAYTVIDGAPASTSSHQWAILQDIDCTEHPGLSAKEYQALWPHAPKPSAKRITELLSANWKDHGWQRSGTGARNNPYRYWQPKPPAEQPNILPISG